MASLFLILQENMPHWSSTLMRDWGLLLLQTICFAARCCCFCGLLHNYYQCLQQIEQQDRAASHGEADVTQFTPDHTNRAPDSGLMQTSLSFSLLPYQHHKATSNLAQLFIPVKTYRMTACRLLQMDYKPQVKCYRFFLWFQTVPTHSC